MHPDDKNQESSFGELKNSSPNPYAQYTGSPAEPGGQLNHPGLEPTQASPGPSPSYEPTGEPPPTTSNGILVNSSCFVVIVGLVIWILFLQNFQPQPQAPVKPEGDLAQLVVTGKVALGQEVMFARHPELEKPQDQNIPFGDFGSVRNRQAGSVMTAELESLDEALANLEKLEALAETKRYQFSESEQRVTESLRQIFHGNQDDLTEQDRELLTRELLWFGDLALNLESQKDNNPEGQRKKILDNAQTVFFSLVGLGLAGFAGLVIGFIGLVIMFFLYASKRLKIRTSAYSQESTIYLESFTVWIVSFVFFSILFELVVPGLNPLVGTLILFVFSFCCGMIWPLFRGQTGSTFLKDIGYCGNPLVEIILSVWCYICSLPVILAGFIVTFIFMLSAPPASDNALVATGPGHPILEWVMNGDSFTILLVYGVSCICAPVVEETFFRGFLYRALKDNSHRLGRFISMLFAAFVNGLVFAAIHPQGIFFIPVLCSLGMAFSFAREWRGSLWTPMGMHAIHNGILTTVLVFAMAP